MAVQRSIANKNNYDVGVQRCLALLVKILINSESLMVIWLAIASSCQMCMCFVAPLLQTCMSYFVYLIISFILILKL